MSFITSIKEKAKTVGKTLKTSYGPLAALEPKSSNSNTLRYPLDVGNMQLYPHTIEFLCWKPEPAAVGDLLKPDADNPIVNNAAADYLAGSTMYGIRKGDASKDSRYSDQVKAAGGSIRDPKNEYLAKRAKGGLKVNQNQKYNGERITDFTRRAELTDVIAMYLPSQTLQETFQNDYSELSITDTLGMLGMAAEAGGSIAEWWNDTPGAGKDLRPFIARAIGDALGGNASTASEVFIQAGGYATNPQLEILYKGSKFRTFDFRFELMPRSRKEADEVLKIVRKFKYHAAPEYREGQGRFWVPPSFFDINILFGGQPNERIPLKMSTCVLTGIDLDMSSGVDQFVSFSDGGPVQIQMQLRFTELEIMHKKLRDDTIDGRY